MSDQEPGQGPPTEPTPDASGDPTRVDTPVSDPTMAMPAPVPPPGGGPPEEPPGPDEPDRPRPDRRPWVIIGLLIVILLVILALVLASDDDDEPSATTSSTPRSRRSCVTACGILSEKTNSSGRLYTCSAYETNSALGR